MRDLASIAALGCMVLAFLADARVGGAESVDYARQVKPVLKERCLACHGALKQKGGLRLDTGASIRQGGDSGPSVEPGEPSEESLLIERVSETNLAQRMPPEGAALTAEQIANLRAWIEQGAKSPEGETPEADPRRHWAFQKLERPSVPQGSLRNEARNPIDAFMAREYERRGLTPLPSASPQVLLRRVYLDLIGLPPSREELHAFLNDPSDAAYAKVVDRLLDSPRYGERWARHWMDVWRYSDWYGRRAVPDVTNSYAQIWRWRDWIVRSLNDDKGYDRMVQEMLAADELAPANVDGFVATGFLVRNWYRWNYNSWMKDNVEHTAKAFLGLTVNCAHCHDHKYDPITQEDYFRLRACFEPLELRHERVAGEADPGPFPKYDYGKAYPPITSGMVRVFDEKIDAKTFLYVRGESRNVMPGRPPIPPGAPAFLDRGAMKVEPVALPVEVYYPGFQPSLQREAIAREEAAVATAEQAWQKARGPAGAALRAAIARATRAAAQACSHPLLFTLKLSGVANQTWKLSRRASWKGHERKTHPSQVAGEERSDALRNSPGIPLRGLEDSASATPGPWKSLVQTAIQGLVNTWVPLRADEAQLASARAHLAAVKARVAADDARYGRTQGDSAALSRSAARAEHLAALAQAEADWARAEKARHAADLKVKTDPKARAELAAAMTQREAANKAKEAARANLAKEGTDYTPLSPVYPPKSSGRRLALARWITGRENPLAARVAVNHIWRWHFGTPLVATTHDFGRNGKAPTHPELLDWLALELMEPSTSGNSSWSMKALHRLIVTSTTYRLASQGTESSIQANRGADPENQAYWRFPLARMEAEVVRDSLLHVAQELDATTGGPDIDFAQGLTSQRRSLYFTHHGEAKMPFLELFDAPDANECYRRTTSVVPQQALALTNNDWLLTLSQTLATRLWENAKTSAAHDVDREFITSAFEQILTRLPSAQEERISAAFLQKQAELFARAGSAASSTEAVAGPVKARRDFIHALFSHHDFVTIH